MRPDHLTGDLFFYPFSFGPSDPRCTRVTARICIGNETFRERFLSRRTISLIIRE